MWLLLFTCFGCRVSSHRVGGTWLSETVNNASARMYFVDGLDPVTTYRIKVTAWTVAGEGEASRVITPTTGHGIPRTAPADLATDVLNKTSIKVRACVCVCACVLIFTHLHSLTHWCVCVCVSAQVTYDLPPSDEGTITEYSIYYRAGEPLVCLFVCVCLRACLCVVDGIACTEWRATLRA